MKEAAEENHIKYCVYFNGMPFGYGEWSRGECEEICKNLNENLRMLLTGFTGGEDD